MKNFSGLMRLILSLIVTIQIQFQVQVATLPMALAGNREDNLFLLQQLTSKLKENLDREDGVPIYHDIYRSWEQKVPGLEKLLDESTEQFEAALSREVSDLKVSHLAFYKLRKGTLGLEIRKDQDGVHRVSHVMPHGPAHKMGIEVGEAVLNINGKSPETQMGPEFPEESVADLRLLRPGEKEPYTRRLIRVAKTALVKGKMGVTTKSEADGTFSILSLGKYSAARTAGLKVGDKVLSIDGEIPRKRLDQGTSPGETSKFVVKRASGEEETVDLTFLSDAALNVPKFQIIEEKGKGDEKVEGGRKGVYLSIPNFSQFYDPNVIHEAMVEAQKEGLLVVDLRNNGGGRSDHFLSYLFKPETSLCSQVGVRFTPKQRDMNKIFAAVVLLKAKNSFEKLVQLYLDKSPQTRQRKETFLLAYEEWKERVASETQGYHGIPKAVRLLLDERKAQLQAILDGRSFACALSQTSSLSLEGELSKWKDETVTELGAIFSGTLVQSRSCKLPAKREVDEWKSFQGVWGQLPQHESFPYTGKVVFLVNNNTYCSAEACAILPLEYQDLKNKGKINGLPYKDQLSASGVKVMGVTQGGAQGRGTSTVETSHGHYHVMYPLYDLFTHVHGRRIEGTGIRREFLESEEDELVVDDESEREILDPITLKRIWDWSSSH